MTMRSEFDVNNPSLSRFTHLRTVNTDLNNITCCNLQMPSSALYNVHCNFMEVCSRCNVIIFQIPMGVYLTVYVRGIQGTKPSLSWWHFMFYKDSSQHFIQYFATLVTCFDRRVFLMIAVKIYFFAVAGTKHVPTLLASKVSNVDLYSALRLHL